MRLVPQTPRSICLGRFSSSPGWGEYLIHSFIRIHLEVHFCTYFMSRSSFQMIGDCPKRYSASLIQIPIGADMSWQFRSLPTLMYPYKEGIHQDSNLRPFDDQRADPTL